MAGLLSQPDPRDAVAQELRRWAAEPFDLAAVNCGLGVAHYVSRVASCDIPGMLCALGTKDVVRMMRDNAAFLRMAGAAMKMMGCIPVVTAKRGDVGLVLMPGSALTAAICMGKLWAARGDHAAIIEPAIPVGVWRLPCPKL